MPTRPVLLYPERWGHLRSRYEEVKPRKMLALDGGGIRGLISLGILSQLEESLAAISGRGNAFRLCDFFEYIAGTSTGAIIAAGLARVQIEQDINCRIAGRCTYGDFIDWKLRDLTCRDAGVDCSVKKWHEAHHVTLDRDLGRAFLYARYNADLSAEGLRALGCGNMDSEKVQKLDAVDQIENLLKIGLSASEKIKLEHFGPFAQQATTA